MTGTISLRLTLEEAVQGLRERKERAVADDDGQMLGDVYFARDGEQETALALNVYPTPDVIERDAPMFNPADYFMNVAFTAVPGLWVDQCVLTLDMLHLSPEKIGRAAYRRALRIIDKEYKGLLELAVRDGRADELGIEESATVILAERNPLKGEPPTITQHSLDYASKAKAIEWLDEKVISHEGEHSGGLLIDALRATFAADDLYELTKTRWLEAKDEATARGESGDAYADPDENFVVARCHTDIAVLRIIAGRGAIVAPIVTDGERSAYMKERLQEFADANDGFLIENDVR